MTHTLRAFVDRDDPSFGDDARDAAADDRASAKADRSDSAIDRETLTEPNVDRASD
jgi:hypothetical protein